jgi:hypothetical protein
MDVKLWFTPSMETLCKVHTSNSASNGFSHLNLPGITGGLSYDRRVEYIIPRDACEQGVYELVIESSCGMFCVSVSDDIFDAPDMNRYCGVIIQKLSFLSLLLSPRITLLHG